MSDFDREDQRLRDTTWTIEKYRELGGIDLDRQKRTIGFERRPLSADRRPRTAAAWGYVPEDRD